MVLPTPHLLGRSEGATHLEEPPWHYMQGYIRVYRALGSLAFLGCFCGLDWGLGALFSYDKSSMPAVYVYYGLHAPHRVQEL